MTLRKVLPASTITLTYSTSGLLDIKCLTQRADYRKLTVTENGKNVERWAVIVDISAIPIETNFDIVVEATYWNAFSDVEGSDYSTYAHKQTDPEELSVILIFPDNKPMKSINILEFNPDGSNGTQFQGEEQKYEGPQQLTYYWKTTNLRPEYYYTFAWKW